MAILQTKLAQAAAPRDEATIVRAAFPLNFKRGLHLVGKLRYTWVTRSCAKEEELRK